MTQAPGRDGVAWVALAALLGLGAVVVTALSSRHGVPPLASSAARGLDWQPALGLRESWRLWTGAWVHWSAAHLAVNLAGAGVVAFVGWRARLPTASAIAWFVAWPLTQALMATVDADRLAVLMPHYGGLSGVLHAGAIVLGLAIAWPAADERPVRERWIGAAIVVGTAAKVVFEAPWNLALHPSAALGIAVAPLAHACGLAAGVMAYVAVRAIQRTTRR